MLQAVQLIIAAALLAAGAYLTVRLRLYQFVFFFYNRHRPMQRTDGISPGRALSTALAASVGTANIAGVAGAIAIGGPGAVFWMWMSALFGMATKYTEVYLAMTFRLRMPNGSYSGGPMIYMRRLGAFGKPLAAVFCVLAVLASAAGGAMTQGNALAKAVEGALAAAGLPEAPHVLLTAGLLTAALAASVILGGAERISRAAGYIVPFMAVLYIAAASAVIFRFSDRVGDAFRSIFTGAFGGFRPALGGVAGFSFAAVMRCGVVRGVFSNEAGAGSSPIAYALADTSDADAQGRLGIIEVFVDTIVICTFTAVALLVSDGAIPYGDASADGVQMMAQAFEPVFGSVWSPLILAASIALFAFTAIIGWSLYGSVCAGYILKGRFPRFFPVVYCLMIPVGAVMDVGAVWTLAELSSCLMALPNMLAVLALSGVAARGLQKRDNNGGMRV